MKSLLLLSFLLFSNLVYTQTKQDTSLKARISKIEDKLSSIDKQNTVAEIDNLKDKLDFQQKMSEQTINSVSVQLNAASNNLTLFGILFAIAAIGLGFYVTRIERKIVKIGEENKELLAKSQKIKDDVDAVNKLIQTDIHKIYIQIKREETDSILDRLVESPIEIDKVGYTLLSRELIPENFTKLRQAYMNWDKRNSNYAYYFEKIFVRHFLAQTMPDKELRKTFSYYIGNNIFEGLENEVLKCTSDFATVLVDEGVQNFKDEINSFFAGLTNSKYKGNNEVYQLLFNNLRSRKNRFDTFNLIESIPSTRKAKIAFGNILLTQYSNDSPSESESLAFKELTELTATQQKNDEESSQKQVQIMKQQKGSS